MAKYTVRFYSNTEFETFEHELNDTQPDSIESLVWTPKDNDGERSGVLVVLRWNVDPDARLTD
jgi:hypothetical protein